MSPVAFTIKKIINQRKMLMKKNISKKNRVTCFQYIDYLSKYIEAFGEKWSTPGWIIFTRNNIDKIYYLAPANKSGESLLLNLKNMIVMKKINVLLVGHTKLNGKISKYDHENVDSISVVSQNMDENLGLIAKANLVVCEEDFDICPISNKVIQIARLTEKEVIHHSRFSQYVITFNN